MEMIKANTSFASKKRAVDLRKNYLVKLNFFAIFIVHGIFLIYSAKIAIVLVKIFEILIDITWILEMLNRVDNIVYSSLAKVVKPIMEPLRKICPVVLGFDMSYSLISSILSTICKLLYNII